jgi:hypothetical protein
VEYRLVDDASTKAAAEWMSRNIAASRTKAPEDAEEQTVLLKDISNAIGLPKTSELLFYFERDPPRTRSSPPIPSPWRSMSPGGQRYQQGVGGQRRVRAALGAFHHDARRRAKFSDVTSEKNHGRKLAIVIDDKVRSAPQIMFRSQAARRSSRAISPWRR